MFRITVLVSGRVQGVGYRYFTRKKALELGLSGYAENLSDGRVEVVAEGEKTDLELLIHHLRQGPRGALVEQIDVQWSKAAGLQGFQIF
ncbi:acylphosphatase [Meiothermus taiwanensis]|uniref:acylphosphatase n=2 Tax=Meiothermus taiwanensis TaxID=172827 RepID=A0A399DSV1_9DEIN|nr:acylphosphatase [Meiothermus taiwanensis]AWR86515.1 acylphosphatase [Meiothermus taiwanensis WR-220]KIQ54990.1 acylphosphatase [Meiothermus taiwanensis]KZK16567.1 acylphosphatase [Meiothermus taiwanensis]RIH75117.1 Acylphosphatase [Meiothermus taiwanensis]